MYAVCTLCALYIRLRELTSSLYPKLRIKARPPIMIFQTRVCIEPSKSKKQQSVPEHEKEIQHFSHLSSVQLSSMQPWSTQPQIMIFQTQNKQPIPEERKCSNIQPHIYNLLFNIDAIHFKWHLYSQSSGAKF